MNKTDKITVRVSTDQKAIIKNHIGKMSYSDYITDLIEQDMNGKYTAPTAKDENALVLIAESFHPTAAPIIELWCKDNDADQSRHIFTMIDEMQAKIETDGLKVMLTPENIYQKARRKMAKKV